jgi:Fe-S-cluster containining protein
MGKSQFYTGGLKFSCKRCSACCRHEPGFVFLSEKDLELLSEKMKMDKLKFIKKYCRWGVQYPADNDILSLSLKEKANLDCIFWETGCTVYDARPLQCRTYPFWQPIVSSKQNWEMTSVVCPGINNNSGSHDNDNYTQSKIEDLINLQKSNPAITKETYNNLLKQ